MALQNSKSDRSTHLGGGEDETQSFSNTRVIFPRKLGGLLGNVHVLVGEVVFVRVGPVGVQYRHPVPGRQAPL